MVFLILINYLVTDDKISCNSFISVNQINGGRPETQGWLLCSKIWNQGPTVLKAIKNLRRSDKPFVICYWL